MEHEETNVLRTGAVLSARESLARNEIVRLLVAGNFHLGARLLEWGASSLGRGEELRRAWREAIDAALDRGSGIDAVVLAGDLFDRPQPEEQDLKMVLADLLRLHEAGRPVFILPGIHDGVYTPRCVYLTHDLPGSVSVVTGTDPHCLSVPVSGSRIHLYSKAPSPNRAGGRFLPETGKVAGEGIHIGLFYAGTEPETGDSAWPVPVLDQAEIASSQLDLVLLGGPHNFLEARWGAVPVVAPGTPVGLRPGEFGDRYRVVVVVEGGGVEVDRTVRDVPSVIERMVDVEAIRDPRALLDHLRPDAVPGSMVSVVLGGEVEEEWDSREVEGILAELPAVIRVENRTVQRAPRRAVVGSDAAGISQAFARRIEELISGNADPAERRVLEIALGEGLRELGRMGSPHVD
jgi:DNA repair exonuclease SbcCD nuclease subunit